MPFFPNTTITENSAIIIQHDAKLKLNVAETEKVCQFAKDQGGGQIVLVAFGDERQKWWQDTKNYQVQAVFIQDNDLVGLEKIIRSSAACLIFSERNSNANQRDCVCIKFGIGDVKYFPIQNKVVNASPCCTCM
ncbi:MAG: hypothetical protein WCW01_04055 [Gammaproteobacteria bacterium]|jgi:hypothetical protein